MFTPLNVHPFAVTGGNLRHFGFSMADDLPTDERPIVAVYPKDDSVHVVAPNLRAFLGLIAVAHGEAVERSATDETWLGARADTYGDDPERLAEMLRLSDALCTIPGVSRPARPASVATAAPDQQFELAVARTWTPIGASRAKSLASMFGVAALVALFVYFRRLPATVLLVALPIAVGAVLLATLRERHVLTIDADSVACASTSGKPLWRFSFREISRVYRFSEQWIFETHAAKRGTFRLTGHEHQLGGVGAELERHAATYRLGWLESIAKIVRALR